MLRKRENLQDLLTTTEFENVVVFVVVVDIRLVRVRRSQVKIVHFEARERKESAAVVLNIAGHGSR